LHIVDTTVHIWPNN